VTRLQSNAGRMRWTGRPSQLLKHRDYTHCGSDKPCPVVNECNRLITSVDGGMGRRWPTTGCVSCIDDAPLILFLFLQVLKPLRYL
jgi:hypothetical protein